MINELLFEDNGSAKLGIFIITFILLGATIRNIAMISRNLTDSISRIFSKPNDDDDTDYDVDRDPTLD